MKIIVTFLLSYLQFPKVNKNIAMQCVIMIFMFSEIDPAIAQPAQQVRITAKKPQTFK